MTERIEQKHRTKERPDFGPTQIRDVETIVPGKVIDTRNMEWESDQKSLPVKSEYRVVELPFKDISGEWKVDVEIFRDSIRRIRVVIRLADFGVTPYRDGLWNSVGWLEDPSKIKTPIT